MARINLTDRFIDSEKRKPAHGRADYLDAIVPGLALRVTSKGHRCFVLVARYPIHPKNPTRRALGDYGEITLEDAREKARGWLALIQKGIDPKVEEARQRAVEQRRQVNTFAAVARQFLERVVKGPAYVELERIAHDRRATDRQMTAKAAFAAVCADPANRQLLRRAKDEGIAKKDEAIRAIDGDFVKRWGARPITDILPEECAAAIRAVVKRGAPYEAHNRLGHLRRLFNWAIGTQEFGIIASPVERLSPKDLIGKREARARVLSDAELSAIWGAAGGPTDASEIAEGRRRDVKRDTTKPMGYPYGPLIKMLILTGQREREVADMSWSEVDLAGGLWTIPARRMKGDRAHEVPLAPDALALLASLPRFNAGEFVFSTTSGAKPVSGFSKTKERIDSLSGVSGWKFHDLRRTARTHFSALPVQDLVRELVIAHARPGLHKVYDQHTYRDEKRECLVLWEARLRSTLDHDRAPMA
jgi:integrase